MTNSGRAFGNRRRLFGSVVVIIYPHHGICKGCHVYGASTLYGGMLVNPRRRAHTRLFVIQRPCHVDPPALSEIRAPDIDHAVSSCALLSQPRLTMGPAGRRDGASVAVDPFEEALPATEGGSRSPGGRWGHQGFHGEEAASGRRQGVALVTAGRALRGWRALTCAPRATGRTADPKPRKHHPHDNHEVRCRGAPRRTPIAIARMRPPHARTGPCDPVHGALPLAP